MIRTVTKCAICLLKEQGVENPEEHVLAQYMMTDPLQPPVPLDAGVESEILMLFPEDQLEETGIVPQTGGIVGTVKSIFKAFGFKGKPPGEPEEQPSTIIAKSKRGTGLYGPASGSK